MRMQESLQMSVSPVCGTKDERYAFVQFTDGKRVAEGKIPSCEILRNSGFSKEETEQLSAYMKDHLKELKSMAAKQNVFEALKK